MHTDIKTETDFFSTPFGNLLPDDVEGNEEVKIYKYGRDDVKNFLKLKMKEEPTNERIKKTTRTPWMFDIWDTHYYAVSKKHMLIVAQMFRNFVVNFNLTYKRQRRDCDDYSKAFAGFVSMIFAINNTGIIIDNAARHAYNFALVHDGDCLDITYIEPQTGEDVSSKRDNMYNRTGTGKLII